MLPGCVSVLCIKHHPLLVVTRYLHPKLDIYCVTALLSLGILEKADHLLVLIDIATELLPPSLIQEGIVSYIRL